MNPTTVSIVLNLHAEGPYIRRTLRSIREAVYFARSSSAAEFELIVVLDRPDAFTREVVQKLDFSFVEHRVVTVDNGSLGLSRNAGISLATGEHVCLADGDDLVSFNYFSGCLDVVRDHPDAAVFPEFLYAFGASYHLTRYDNGDTFSPVAFFDMHPYISRIFMKRKILARQVYVDTPRNGPYAYEDWHMNATLAASGCDFRIAKNAWLFYRQRAQSIMATTGQQKIIPFTPFFLPAIYRNFSSAPPPKLRSGVSKEEILGSHVSLEIIHASNQIEPAIDMEHLKWAEIWVPPTQHAPNGRAYLEACQRIEHEQYDHVVLLPFISRGGAEKFLFNILSEIQMQEGGRTRILLLLGEAFEAHEWPVAPRFSHTAIDLFRIAQPHDADPLALTFRLLQSVAATAQVHLLSCSFSLKYLSKYRKCSASQRVVFYSFLLPHFQHLGRNFSYGDSFTFISETAEVIDCIVSDNKTMLRQIEQAIDLPKTQLQVLYSKIELPEKAPRPRSTGPRTGLRLLWASRIDHEKRPELLAQIARLLHGRAIPACIDAYGSSVLKSASSELLKEVPGLSFKGKFDGLGSLPLDNYDALIYTSFFDGVPNVLLEAMAGGLPVIAPDVGGISEVVIDGKTGVLLPHEPDPDRMAQSYVRAIERIIAGEVDLAALSTGAFALLARQHAPGKFSSEVKRIFIDAA